MCLEHLLISAQKVNQMSGFLVILQMKICSRDFPGSPVVNNLPDNEGSIPGQGTKIPHATGQLSPRAANYRAHVLWNPGVATTEEKIHMPQIEKSPRTTTKSPRAATKDPPCLNEDTACRN